QTLQLYETQIATNNIDAILSKGFTLTTNAAGKRLRSTLDVQENEVIRTYFSDGTVESVKR
ncbi:MAG: hypothetical protein LBM68_00095, partial [Bacteroidales bacterium]|nr:hypothetical protein [Bacteroidales bacterium]